MSITLSQRGVWEVCARARLLAREAFACDNVSEDLADRRAMVAILLDDWHATDDVAVQAYAAFDHEVARIRAVQPK